MAEAISDVAREYLEEEQIRAMKKSEKATAGERNALRNLMAHKDFYQLIKILLDITNFNGNNYTDDTHLTYHLGGRSYVMYELLSILGEVDPTFYPRTLLKLMEADNDTGSK